jgi:hypothetical protein
MMKRETVEQYLRANGVQSTASDDEIKEMLFSARWHESDVDTALTVLREDPKTHTTKVDTLHKVFHSDERLEPETISALLGIEVQMPEPPSRFQESKEAAASLLTIIVVACALSAVFVLSVMWYLRMGIFFGY